jgi:hypothetical protein
LDPVSSLFLLSNHCERVRLKQAHSEERIVLTRSEQLVLHLTVTITGAAVRVLKLLGTRIIGPFYGVAHRSNFYWNDIGLLPWRRVAIGFPAVGLATPGGCRPPNWWLTRVHVPLSYRL